MLVNLGKMHLSQSKMLVRKAVVYISHEVVLPAFLMNNSQKPRVYKELANVQNTGDRAAR